MAREGKRIAASLVVLTALSTAVWLAADVLRLEEHRGEALARIETLPPVGFVGLDDEVYSVEELPPRPTALVFFATTCRFCESEVTDLVAHADLFTGVNVVLISPQDVPSLREFSRFAGLDTLSQFTVGSDSGAAIGRLFDVRRIPSVFVYDTGRRLVRRFQGVTSASAIVEAIREAG